MTGGAASQMVADPERIGRLVATVADRFVGTDLLLIAELSDDRVIVADEHDPHWSDALDAIDRSGRAAYPSPEWLLRLLADEARTPIVLIGP